MASEDRNARSNVSMLRSLSELQKPVRHLEDSVQMSGSHMRQAESLQGCGTGCPRVCM